jgi:hypothetical protein
MNRANDMHAKQSVKSYITYYIFRANSFLKNGYEKKHKNESRTVPTFEEVGRRRI